ncbi:hypothetical protein JAAARDRAFT_88231, partial [Jaapia argillacea MUCL 33604]
LLTAKRLDPTIQGDHKDRDNCACIPCSHDRLTLGCKRLHTCTKRAHRLLGKLTLKYTPHEHPHNNNLSFTHRRVQRNEYTRAHKEEILFDPSMTLKEDLSEGFRVFTGRTDPETPPADRLHAPVGRINANHKHLTIFTDGSCMNNGLMDAYCRSGMWFGKNDARNCAIKVLGTNHSNQIGELVAVICCLKSVNNFRPVTIVTD